MNAHLPAPYGKWPGRLVNLAVVVVVLALAAATFVLSYPGVHAIAVQAGVSARLARLYPGLFDAVLVIACVAAVMLRDARWWTRVYAWLVIIVVVAAVGAADAVHAMNVALPHRKTEGVVAAAPWVLVLLGFSVMLTMLRHSRAQHIAAGTATDRAARRAAKGAADETLPVAPMDLATRSIGQPAPTPALPPGARAIPTTVPVPAAITPALDAALLPEATLPLEAAPTREEPIVLEAATREHAASAITYAPDVADEAPPTGVNADIDARPAEPGDGSADTDTVAPEPAAADEPEPAAATAPQPAAADEEEPAAAGAEEPAAAGAEEPAAAGAEEPAAADEPEPATATLERATVAGGPAEQSHDYWDAEEGNGLGKQNSPSAGVELNEDAPPFATAPFATVPRLNRVRSTPIPPEDDEE
jgi:hypothetical protein